jgi:nanoRNase/pAp phosphatase (c-di-AMP/oligoRNAs hydrolase)
LLRFKNVEKEQSDKIIISDNEEIMKLLHEISAKLDKVIEKTLMRQQRTLDDLLNIIFFNGVNKKGGILSVFYDLFYFCFFCLESGV